VALCGFRVAGAQAPGDTSPASQTPGVVAPATGQPKALFINIIEGEGALNDIRTRTVREPIVEVDDENHNPVAGALVLFAIDNGGSGSPFATFNGANSVSVEQTLPAERWDGASRSRRIKGRIRSRCM
jgi:hypothetical protein